MPLSRCRSYAKNSAWIRKKNMAGAHKSRAANSEELSVLFRFISELSELTENEFD